MARLLVGPRDHGPHLFIVQLRFLVDGKPLPGIKLGDIGLKMAYNGVDNDFATFTHVRIPRSNMLTKYAMVAPDGTYTAVPNNIVLTHSTMLLGRDIIARVAVSQLAQATTVATRYSTVREQGYGPDGIELPIIHYKHQQSRLLTLVAKSYAMLFAAKHCSAVYKRAMKQREQGDLSVLPYVHCLTAGLKAWSTGEAADGVEDARKCCGGHGFLVISGLPDIVASSAGMATFKGENYVLWLQVGRYLLKCVDSVVQGKKLHHEMAYLADETAHLKHGRVAGSSAQQTGEEQGTDFLQRDVQLEVYRCRAYRLIQAVHGKVRGSKKTPEEAWNEHMLPIITASRAHVEYTVLRTFNTHLSNLKGSISAPLELLLEKLCSLFALSSITNSCTVDATSFIEDGYLSSLQMSSIRESVNGLLK
ncbi:acyl-CoA dehydrogenase/oxidase C-terminal [Bimuria novae-zelandiae CBS 107.79]|uniref:Acyl-CoA dehydrogenase/oxidase C-terminal n=1 Tax=Bimuria novae-zelandiae CBS 107.79 TaxID=1447943 RepID=A0A6A5V368_9PLEO|nr:acyl-CoA dehydrogenase/oxidase C-terminal [Bimuria novae-zelandiae CBS 107.79]